MKVAQICGATSEYPAKFNGMQIVLVPHCTALVKDFLKGCKIIIRASDRVRAKNGELCGTVKVNCSGKKYKLCGKL